ncbi:MAG: putative small lipoprotein YifL [Bradymonadia bacterium]|jgi:predicted small lipoprotein YifL
MRSFKLLAVVALLAGCGDDAPLFYYPLADASTDAAPSDAAGEDVAEPDTAGDVGDPPDANDAGEDPVEDTLPDTEPDTGEDVEEDAEADTSLEVSPDADPDSDAGPDVSSDTEPDIEPDLEPDTTADVEPDLPFGCTSIAEVRTSPLGFVEGTLCNVVVTYVSPFGFFVQERNRTGPAIHVLEAVVGWTNPEGIEVGDALTFDASELGEFRGMEQIIARSSAIREARGFNVDSITQSLDVTGTLPSESNEAERVSIDGGLITAIVGRDLTVEYGGVEAILRVADPAPFCVGLGFDMTGVITENAPDGFHRIESWWVGDFSFVAGDCVSDLPLAGVGDLVINEVLADPPDTGGDANCDGERIAGEDEFLEILNVSSVDLSLAGISISDAVSIRHTFGSLSEIGAGEAILVFGGGDLDCDFAGTPAELGSTGALGLSNSGDTVSILSSEGVIMETMTYTTRMSTDVSVVLSPEGNTDGIYVRHSDLAPDMSPYSAGRRTNGTPF